MRLISMRLIYGLLGAWLVLGQQASAPATNAEQNGAVFSVTTTLVQVDAVVTDGKGRNAASLTPDDFRILIDGKPQKVTRFSYVSLSSAAAAPAGHSATAIPALRGLPPAPSAPVRAEDVRRTIVLMVDDLGLSFESMAYVRTSLRQFVERQMQPGDLVAVVRTGAGSGSLEQFTSDRRVLLSVVDGLRWNPNGRSGINVFRPYGQVSDAAEKLADMPSGGAGAMDVRYEIRNRTISTVGTIGSISYIVDALREMPGRKSIALFSDGMELFTPAGCGPQMHTGGGGGERIEDNSQIVEAMRRLIDRANRAGTVIYTMESTGLQTGQPDAADRITGTAARLAAATQVGQCGGRDWTRNVNQQGLAYLADRTGGLAYENGNDLNFGLDRMLEDQKGYYLLGFQPPDGMLSEKGRKPGFHSVKVTVAGAGMSVRSRSGFYGQTDEEVTVAKPRTTIEQMRAALLSPFQSSGVRLRLTALYAESPKGEALVRNLLHIDAHDLTWVHRADGTASAELQVLALATGAGDAALDAAARDYTLKVQAGKFDEAIRDGVVYTLDVPVPKRGAYQIRVAVRDGASSQVGSASQFVEIPDLKRVRFALASIVLQDAGAKAGGEFLTIGPARRQFRQGGELEYMCAVERGGDKRATTELTTRVQIVRDGKEVYAANGRMVDVPNRGQAVFGALRLTAQLAPGEYYLHVVATDPRGGKNAAADQWVDFEVVP